MPADLAHRFLANRTLLNAKKTRADFQRPGGVGKGAFYAHSTFFVWGTPTGTLCRFETLFRSDGEQSGFTIH